MHLPQTKSSLWEDSSKQKQSYKKPLILKRPFQISFSDQTSSLMSLYRSLLGKKQTDLKIRSMFRGRFYKFSQNAERIPLFIGLQRKYLPFSIVFVYRVILCDHS